MSAKRQSTTPNKLSQSTLRGKPSTGNLKSSQSQSGASSQKGNQSTMLSQAQKAVSAYTKEDQDRWINDLVQYLLIMDQKKLPIKKQDIYKHVLKNCNKQVFPNFIAKAASKLSSIFGMELVELQDKQKGTYILINKLDPDTAISHLEWSEEDNARTGLLMVILSLIFMNGNVMQDDQLNLDHIEDRKETEIYYLKSQMWHALKRLGIDHEATVHETFGEAKRLITQEFVRQGYIEYIKQPNTDPPTYEFKWGQRAKMETTKKNVLEFVCQIYDKEPAQWTSQWQDIERSDVKGDNSNS